MTRDTSTHSDQGKRYVVMIAYDKEQDTIMIG